VVDCIIGCSEVNKDCACDLLFFVSILYVLGEVEELSAGRASWSEPSLVWVEFFFYCGLNASHDHAFVQLVEDAQ